MDVNLDYIGVGVNRVVNALAWGEHGGVAYAAHHMIALYDVEAAQVVSTLCGHTGLVNCVLWVPHEATPELPPSQHLLLSGAADSTICCWLITYPGPPSGVSAAASSPRERPSWRRLAVLQGHSAPVTSLAVHRPPHHPTSASDPTQPETQPALLLVSTAGDSDVIVWACGSGSGAGGLNGGDVRVDEPLQEGFSAASSAAGESGRPAAAVGSAAVSYGQSQWRLEQRLPVGTRMQTAAALTALPRDPDWTLLATGGTDRRVALYVRPPGGPRARFSPACVLDGHENWVRGVAFCAVEGPAGPQLLLASVSQDRYGRIWKLQPEPLVGSPAAAAREGSLSGSAADGGRDGDGGADPLAALIQRYAPKPHVATDKTRYVASCEALLIGHEDWVHGLQWAPPPPQEPADGAAAQGPSTAASQHPHPRLHTRSSAALLTASMDRTMVIWRFEASSGLWMNEASLGDAGASCLGYFGGVWGPRGEAILAHGFTGALHLWRQPPPPPGSVSAPGPPLGPWLPRHALGGHFGAVVDLGWGLDGGCLLSVSEDQTARVHAGVVWRRRDTSGRQPEGEGEGAGGEQRQQRGGEAGAALHWCEVARAQIHGHDFRCVAPVASPPGEHYVYVSGSEEKVLRVLEAPQAFIDTLVALRGGEDSAAGRAIRAEGRRGRGFGAAVAALGLSNKAVDEGQAAEGAAGGNADVGGGLRSGGDYTEGPDVVPSAAPQVVREPPLEEHLAQNTLWPETHKLYGHGNDVFCSAASPDGRYLASACKAQTASTASIWIWCTRTWRPVAQLRAHTLTVTQIEWSASSSMLAAGSRDRTFSVFRRRDPPAAAATSPGVDPVPAAEGGEPSFELLARVKNAHGRVIWSVSWSLDEQLLATASRDETVKVWQTGGEAGARAEPAAPVLAATLPQFGCAATAVAFAPRCPARAIADGGGVSGYVMAVGLEDGSLHIWRLAAGAGPGRDVGAPGGGLAASCLWVAGAGWRHAGAVRRLRWRGAPGGEGEGEGEAAAGVGGAEGVLQLASGSEDHSVRVFSLAGL